VFAQTIHTTDYHVFVRAQGPCQGLTVQAKTATGFTVRCGASTPAMLTKQHATPIDTRPQPWDVQRLISRKGGL